MITWPKLYMSVAAMASLVNTISSGMWGRHYFKSANPVSLSDSRFTVTRTLLSPASHILLMHGIHSSPSFHISIFSSFNYNIILVNYIQIVFAFSMFIYPIGFADQKVTLPKSYKFNNSISFYSFLYPLAIFAQASFFFVMVKLELKFPRITSMFSWVEWTRIDISFRWDFASHFDVCCSLLKFYACTQMHCQVVICISKAKDLGTNSQLDRKDITFCKRLWEMLFNLYVRNS